jgi:choline kinase
VTVTQTVILAAGSGSRLDSAASGVPKPLMRVGGEPLIAHALAHARASGCTDAIVVVGFEAARVRTAVDALPHQLRVTFVVSPDHTAPNGVSLLAAAPHAASTFFLQMVDHVFADLALPALVAAPLVVGQSGRVLVDRTPTGIDLDDATKVQLEGDRVTAIGKGLARWDAIDAGCFVLTHDVFAALEAVPAAEARTVSSGMRRLVSSGRLGAADANGVEWVDVDTPADRQAAERLLARRESRDLRLETVD